MRKKTGTNQCKNTPKSRSKTLVSKVFKDFFKVSKSLEIL
ncbi:hypothetical protein D922_00664 [Enterococcus faecalis 06-MB-DW-09]|nr:hypothetical protein D922_00664 [Enterococcus faecalis 06-MB-DW-09]